MADQYSSAPSGATAIQDLKVAIYDSSVIRASSPQAVSNKSVFLNNMDRSHALMLLQTLHFFSPNSHFTPHAVSSSLRTALQRLVDEPAYHFLAGRLNMDYETDMLEIDCNDAGVGFVVASSELSINEIGNVVYPNPAFGQLLNGVECFDDDPLCILQVTSFICGSFVMGLALNHALFDGVGSKIFLDNLASQAFDDKRCIAIIPYNDRSLLNPRSPPCVNFPHREIKPVTGLEKEPIRSVFEPRPEYDDNRTFTLSSDDVRFLKEKAEGSTNATKFNVVAAHVWRCKALSKEDDENDNGERESLLLYAVNIRPRLKPPLPENYCGNAVVHAYASAKCWELEKGPFWRIVDRVYEGVERMTDEYARSFLDWTEIHGNGYQDGETLISSWWRLGFEKVEYPWGNPRYCGPLLCGRMNVILLTPEIDGGGGVNVFIAMARKEMDKFHSLFYHYLRQP